MSTLIGIAIAVAVFLLLTLAAAFSLGWYVNQLAVRMYVRRHLGVSVEEAFEAAREALKKEGGK